jgi:tripartite-type tricarboxylate transporter receptor subunit TctC
MKRRHRHGLFTRTTAAVLLATWAGLSPLASAQDNYPSRPITLVIPLSAGSQMDIIGRALAEALGKIANQPVIVLNKEGAATVIGVDAVAKAKPDGYTVGFGPDGAFVVQPHLNSSMPFRQDDLEFICQTNSTQFVFLVGPQSPHKTVGDLAEAARKSPVALNYGTAGVATTMHLLAESVAAEAGVRFNHVPFRNIGDLAVQTLNGNLDFTVSVPNMLAVNSAKGMRGLGVSGEERLASLPMVPLLRDQGFGQTAPSSGIGMFVPKGLPAQTLAWLRKACRSSVESAGFMAASARSLTAVQSGDGPAFAREVERGSRTAGELMKKLNITAQ